jgi:hypothetical protein
LWCMYTHIFLEVTYLTVSFYFRIVFVFVGVNGVVVV